MVHRKSMATYFSTTPFLVLILFISSSIIPTIRSKRIGAGDIIRDGQTFASENDIFVLGFFDPKSNTESNSLESKYLGIWYNFSTDMIVWVGNREYPITHSFGVLQLTVDGQLIISQNQSNTTTTTDDIVWSSNSRNSMVVNPVLTLLDSGNLIITNGTDDGGAIIWQSFDYPTDTLLPNMKLGFNKKTGLQRYMSAWKQLNDPSPSDFVLKMDTTGLHELYTASNSLKQRRYGSWNGEWFVGNPKMKTDNVLSTSFVDNEEEVFFSINVRTIDLYTKLSLFPNHTLSRKFKNNKNGSRWVSYATTTDACDNYNHCGPNGVCNPQNLTKCECFDGFHPKSASNWNKRDFSLGCERNEVLNCSSDEGFLQYSVKTPDTTNSTIHKDLTITQCKDLCINNCSCMAYAPIYLKSYRIPRGCIMWYGDQFIDTVLLDDDDGLELYLRLSKSQLSSNSTKSPRKTIIIATVVPGVIIISLFGIFVFIRKNKRRLKQETSNTDDGKWKDEVHLFDFPTIAFATNNFSSDNIIGKGGFGVVYKGKIKDGEEIAVKRLSKASEHRFEDFLNQVVLVAKLQHKNLLQLLGCCIERNERILVYEFMKNASLDTFIFGEKKHLLVWQKRVEIIIGIAKGLLYLHQDSRLKIIHRDLKPSNILLDEMMNPKISDFDTARLFQAEQLEENTNRIIGTFGYMPPEYVINGTFSLKSDVFSFGVLLLEIISGMKNQMCYENMDDVNFLGWAWRVCKEGNILMLVDESLSGSCSVSQVSRFIKIGLLCVQNRAFDRPTMSEVFLMLSNDSWIIKDAKKPPFCEASSKFTNDSMSFSKYQYIK